MNRINLAVLLLLSILMLTWCGVSRSSDKDSYDLKTFYRRACVARSFAESTFYQRYQNDADPVRISNIANNAYWTDNGYMFVIGVTYETVDVRNQKHTYFIYVDSDNRCSIVREGDEVNDLSITDDVFLD